MLEAFFPRADFFYTCCHSASLLGIFSWSQELLEVIKVANNHTVMMRAVTTLRVLVHIVNESIGHALEACEVFSKPVGRGKHSSSIWLIHLMSQFPHKGIEVNASKSILNYSVLLVTEPKCRPYLFWPELSCAKSPAKIKLCNQMA